MSEKRFEPFDPDRDRTDDDLDDTGRDEDLDDDDPALGDDIGDVVDEPPDAAADDWRSQR